MADYKTPQWLLPNEKNLAYPAAGAGVTGSGLSEDRHSLYSMDFNGTDYISAPNTFLNSASVCTLSFWMKGTGEVGGGAPWNGIQIQAGVSTTSFRTMNGSNVNNYVSFSPGTDWHHYLGVYVGGSYSKLYIDGVLKSTLSTGIPATLASTSGDIFKIGYGQSYSVAKIDEVAIWNRQLTDGGVADGVTAGGEIATIYNSGAPGNLMALSAKPTAYYPLGEQAQMGSANWSFPNGSLQSHVIDFDGTDYISTGLDLSYASVPTWTISYWIRCDRASLTNFQSYFAIGTSTTQGSYQYSPGRLYFQPGPGLNVYNQGTPSGGGTTDLSDGEWHNVVQTYVDQGGSVQTTKIYVDGNSTPEVTSNTLSFYTLNGDLFIGFLQAGVSVGAGFAFIGEISNVAIWNSDQSANIANIYNNGSPKSTYTTTPTAWWKLNAANSSYVYPWSLELNGSPDVSGSGDHAKVVSNALQVQDINTTGTSGKVDFLTREITGAYSGIDVTGEFIVYAASSGQSGATLYYKIDGGNWVQFQQELRTDNTATTYAISGASGLTSTTSFQVKIEFETGSTGTPYVTLNNISIGGLYTEDFTNQDGAGWDNDAYTPPPVDWTFIDTETPAPNYTSALDFDGALIDGININNDSSLEPSTSFTLSCWIKSETSQNFYAYPVYKESLDSSHVAYGFYLQGSSTIATTVTTNGVITSDNIGDLRDGKWHHVVQTYDGSGMKVYLDGVQSGTTKSITGNVVYSATSTELYIGNTRRTSPSGYFSFKGNISNVALFNTAIDAAGVSTLFNSGTPQTSISYSPTSWWKLDNITTGIQDSVGSNNGTITGSVTQIATNVLISNDGTSTTLPSTALVTSDLQFESPYSNYSLSFDGVNDLLLVPNASTQFAELDGLDTFSVSMWVKPDSSPVSSTMGLFGLPKTGWNLNLAANYIPSSNSISVEVNSAGSNDYSNTSVTLSTSSWSHLVFVFDRVNESGSDRIKLYINGVSYANASNGNWTQIASTGSFPFVIGGHYQGNSGVGGATEWTGFIDETALWNSPLTQAQINQIYNNGYPNDITSLSPSNWWRLGEDAYFVNNLVTIPNQITGGQTGTGSGTQTAILVGNAPGSYANGSGVNLAVEDRIGDAPESTANSVSRNMIPSNRHSYPAGYVPTQVNNAFSMDFDGADDYVNLGNGVSFEYTNSFSYSFWVKPEAISGVKYLYSKYDSGRGILIYYNSAGASTSAAISLDLYNTNSGSTATRKRITTVTGNILTKNVWSNIVITYDGSGLGSGIELYKDGASQTVTVTQDNLQNNTIVNTENAYLGSYNGTGSFFPGNLDEVAIFNYALSERQIKQDIYEGTTAGGKTADLNNISNLTAPVAWYRMGD